jgi:hypothetical protein
MIQFFLSADLWANIIGGVVAAVLFTLAVWLWNRQRRKILEELIEIMGRAIKHRNLGEQKAFSDAKEWVQQAMSIEEEAVAKAKQLSPAAGSHVEWLDRVPPWDSTSDVSKYVSFLSKVIERIRELMQHYY